MSVVWRRYDTTEDGLSAMYWFRTGNHPVNEGPWILGNLDGVEPTQAGMELIGKRVNMGFKVFPGDKYSAGDGARPLFSLIT